MSGLHPSEQAPQGRLKRLLQDATPPRPFTPEQADAVRQVYDTLEGIRLHAEQTARLTAALTPPRVLRSSYEVIPAGGVWSTRLPVRYRYVHVTNFGAPLVVANDAPQATAPGTGPGSKYVPGPGSLGANLSGTAITVYGQPGTGFNLELHDRPQTPASSITVESSSSGIISSAYVEIAAAGDIALITAEPALFIGGMSPSGEAFVQPNLPTGDSAEYVWGLQGFANAQPPVPVPMPGGISVVASGAAASVLVVYQLL